MNPPRSPQTLQQAELDFGGTAGDAGPAAPPKTRRSQSEQAAGDRRLARRTAGPLGTQGRVTAETLAKQQREISVSEFFAKNRHLLGFDNKRKSLLTTVKEAVDNSLDACEEASILPDLLVEVSQRAEDRFRVVVQDNGPGVVKQQIPNIFGKLLYGSKFHRLKMARGQQGIGISAAGMYGLLTTGTPVSIISRTGPNKPAHHYKIAIDTKKNRPEIVHDDEVEVDWPHGTRVEINLVASYAKGR
jgi:DNA topoisomerase-6 subunit B